MQRKLEWGVLVVVVLATATSGVVLAASSDFDISIVGGIETPAETVDIANEEYEIDELGVIEPGTTIEIDVTSPDSYDVLLYTTEKQYEDTAGGESSERFAVGDGGDLDTSALDPGTYMLSLEPDGEGRQAVAPVVVQGYDVSLAYPSTVEAGDDVTFEATVEPLEDGNRDQPADVELAIWDGEEATEITLEHDGGTDYETTESPGLEPGTYDVYGAVPGDDRVEGYPTVLAVSDGDELTVTDGTADGGDDEPAGSPGSGTDDGNESDDGADGDTDSDDETDGEAESGADNETTEPGENEDPADGEANETTAANGTDEVPDGEANGTTETGQNGTETDDTTADSDSEDENAVIEPNDANDTSQTDNGETTDDDGLGTPTAIPGVIALAGFLLAVAVRTRR